MSSPRRVISLLLLALLAVCLPVSTANEDTATATKDYEILSNIKEDSSSVAVIRRNEVLFLLYDQTIIGAEFDDPYLRKQAAYPGFAIMQCVRYIDRTLTKAIQVGLGIGTVPSFLRNEGIPTDVVEISKAVVRQAANFFQYEHCEVDDPEDCDRGTTYITDGLKFIDNTPAEPVYDTFIIDVYTGWNPVAFFEKEVIDTVHAKWLKTNGVMVLNFVGFIVGEHADVPKSIYRTLQTSFKHVKAYREVPEDDEASSINIVFFASDEPFTFTVPTDGEYADPPIRTYFHVVKFFQQWEIFKELQAEVEPSVEIEVSQATEAEEVTFSAATQKSSRVQVLTKEDSGAEVFRGTHEFTQEHMRHRVVEQFPLEMWAELGIDVPEAKEASV